MSITAIIVAPHAVVVLVLSDSLGMSVLMDCVMRILLWLMVILLLMHPWWLCLRISILMRENMLPQHLRDHAVILWRNRLALDSLNSYLMALGDEVLAEHIIDSLQKVQSLMQWCRAMRPTMQPEVCVDAGLRLLRVVVCQCLAYGQQE